MNTLIDLILRKLYKRYSDITYFVISWQDFEKVEMRVGTIISADDFPEAKNPSYKLKINFGQLGIKRSSAQITKLYKKEDLLNKQVIAVTNFPPKQIATFVSECLVLGLVLEGKNVVLLQPERKVENGYRVA
jgi:tRNA-binding protein